MEQLSAFLLAGLALTGSPGPANLSLAAMGAAFGWRASLGYQAGAVAGMALIMTVTASGLAALLLALPGVRLTATLAGSAYILWLAWRIASAPARRPGTASGRVPSFLGGLALQLANPKAYAAMAALFSGFALVAADPLLDAAWKIALLLCVITLVTTLWLHLGAQLARLSSRPRLDRAIKIALAAALLAATALALSLQAAP